MRLPWGTFVAWGELGEGKASASGREGVIHEVGKDIELIYYIVSFLFSFIVYPSSLIYSAPRFLVRLLVLLGQFRS
jgi:hypothetical protein